MRLLIFDILDVLLPLGVGVLLFVIGGVLRRLPLALRILLVVVAVGVVVVGALALARRLPAEYAFYLSRIGGGTLILGCVALFLLGIVWSVPRRSFSSSFIIALAVLAACLIVIETSGRLWWRYGDTKRWQRLPELDGTLQQTSGATCGPTAAAMLLYHYDIRASEGEMAYLAGTSLFGSDAPSLANALERKAGQHGWHAVYRHTNYDECQQRGVPFVAHVSGESSGHALLVESMDAERVIVVDPALGKRGWIHRKEFVRIWDGTAIYLARNAS